MEMTETVAARTTGGESPLSDESAHWTLEEWGYGAFLVVFVMGILFVSAVGMAGGMWLFHFGSHCVFRALFDNNYDPVVADAIGNALGSVIIIVLSFVMILATLLTMGERKWSAFIQDRMGPNRARLPGLPNSSLWGLPHIIADVLKMLTKEELVPEMANKIVFHLAPALAFGPAFVLFAVIPMAPDFNFSLFGYNYSITMQVARIDQGLLYIFAIASIAVLGTSLAGWSSNNKYALLGGVRASAQMISYEVTLGLTLVGLMIVYHSLQLNEIADTEGQLLWGWLPKWGIVFQPLAIVAYFAAASAEIKRAPFDLPEGESEIVGYFLEYSGLKFGIFMIAEFVEVVVFAGLFTTLFFGAYHYPFETLVKDCFEKALPSPWGGTVVGVCYLTSFLTKTFIFCWLSLTVRWTFPRFRYDQVMDLGWKILLPVSLANVVVTGLVVLAGGKQGQEYAAAFGLIELALMLLFAVGSLRLTRHGGETLLPAVVGPSSHGADAHAAAAHGDHH